MKYELYGFQEKLYQQSVDLIESGEKSFLIQLATRGGKSAVASKLIEKYYSKGIYFLAHTDILINQMSDELVDHGIRHQFLKAGRPEVRSKVMVISKDTLISRIKRLKSTGWKDPFIIFIDEAHLSMAESFLQIIRSYPNSIIIGMSATLCRLDGKPLGSVFKKVILGPTDQYLQDQKVLCGVDNIVAKNIIEHDFPVDKDGDFKKSEIEEAVNQRYIIKDVVKQWEQYALWEKTLTFCTSIDHAENIAQQFNEKGYPSVAISSADDEYVIKQKLADYYSGKYINICSVNLFLMGMTVKDCGCIIQARPTASYMIYKQSLGRGRIYKNGKNLINLDCVNNYERHGDPTAEYDWDIFKDETVFVSDYKRCPQCDITVLKTLEDCPDCGYFFQKSEGESKPRIINEIDGIMVRVDENEIKNNNYLINIIASDGRSESDAIKIAVRLGFGEDVGIHIWNDILRKVV